jgi:hypothetical protein
METLIPNNTLIRAVGVAFERPDHGTGAGAGARR